MKRLKYYIVGSAIAAFAVVACQKDNVETFSGTDNIYFSFATLDGKDGLAIDSLGISLLRSNVKVEDSTIAIRVSIMGIPAKEDRPISVVSLSGEDYPRGTAVEGVGKDYEILPSVIPADSVWGEVKVKILRTAALDAAGTGGLRMKLKLMPNEYFKTDYTRLRDEGAYTDALRSKYNMNGIEYKVFWQNDAEESILWNESLNPLWAVGTFGLPGYRALFGDFSAAKVNMLIAASGLPYEAWYPTEAYINSKKPNPAMTRPTDIWGFYLSMLMGNTSPSSPFGATYDALRTVNQQLAKARKDGSPILDENGQEVVLGTDGQNYL